MNNIDLKELFEGLQGQMIAKLNLNRKFIIHPTSKGDALENAWIEWLREYLPNRYSIESAIVIDNKGNISDQIDIVIFDAWFTPFIFSQNGFKYIPIEGVYAAFEVKPDIKGDIDGKNFIQYAGEKIESVRRLERTSAGMINSGWPVPARPFSKIIGGILANTNTYSEKDDNKTIKKHLSNLQGFQKLDMGCIADYGSFYVNYDKEEDTTLNTSAGFKKRYTDYYMDRQIKEVIFSKKGNAIITFFLQLSRYLQQGIGTIPAIDFGEYANSIGFKIDYKL